MVHWFTTMKTGVFVPHIGNVVMLLRVQSRLYISTLNWMVEYQIYAFISRVITIL